MLTRGLSTIFLFVFAIAGCIAGDSREKFAEDIYEEEYGKIIHSSVLFRHGDRNPYAPYPFDPYKDHQWLEGLGHLTKAGKKRMYNVGKWFRKRYRNIIGDRYFHVDVKMESSDYDRSLMSAECFLAGFYPPNEDEIWHEELKWQPVPVHSIPLAQDNMIAMFKLCDAYNAELFSTNTAPKFKEMFKKHQSFFNYVGMNTGIMFNENFLLFALFKIMEVYDALNVQSKNNFSLPVWATTVFPEPMASLAIKLFDFGTYTDKMKRLKSGPFLKSITIDMYKKAYEQLEQSIHFYSGHDATIATIMITLGIYDHILPPYGSALIFELREKPTDYFVTVLYRNSTETPPILLSIPECGSRCNLEAFLDLTKPFLTEDWDRECQVQPVFPQMQAFTNNGWYATATDIWIYTQGQAVILASVIAFIAFTMMYFNLKRHIDQATTILLSSNLASNVQR